MLVVCNGSFKSGSTWLYNITKIITGFPPPPQKFLNSQWVNSSIHPDHLKDIISKVDFEEQSAICKNHFGNIEQAKILLNNSNVRVLGITRDLKDVVVSAFHHHKNKKDFKFNFKVFYWTIGRRIAMRVRDYNNLWSRYSTNQHVYISSYELLKQDFEEECIKIADFLGIKIDLDKAEQIKNETSLKSLREKYTDKSFFRKGKTGNYKEYFDEDMIMDINKIISGMYACNGRLNNMKEKVRGLGKLIT
ncbi:MAG: sulfotransferase domain-containing protein [Bacteroidota bacterium]